VYDAREGTPTRAVLDKTIIALYKEDGESDQQE